MCDGVENAIRPKNSAQELLLCVLFFRLVMCDGEMWCGEHPAQELGPRTSSLRSLMCDGEMWCGEPSGPRTRPKNFFFVFSSFGL